MKGCVFIFCLALLLSACKEGRQKKDAPLSRTGSQGLPESASILQLDQRLLTADSMVFVFYKEPHGPDSLRYTRYYKQYSTTDSLKINFVLKNLEGDTEGLERMRPCRSEGKIWCYSGRKIFQTIYFSDYNAPCNFVYIIKDGRFYYAMIPSALSRELDMFRREAKEI